ncbi:MAG: hypothetical protein IT567_04020 [Alphaproteobacteria bacterium]|nr:hypothetical protein [Alphaproteobacteria bacterium]
MSGDKNITIRGKIVPEAGGGYLRPVYLHFSAKDAGDREHQITALQALQDALSEKGISDTRIIEPSGQLALVVRLTKETAPTIVEAAGAVEGATVSICEAAGMLNRFEWDSIKHWCEAIVAPDFTPPLAQDTVRATPGGGGGGSGVGFLSR